MKFNRRFAAFFLAVVLIISGLSVTAFAADDEIARVRILTRTRSLRVGDDITLETEISAGDYSGDYEWTSSNDRVATVDSGGNVVGEAPGTARIKVRLDNGRSDTCAITVTGTARDYYDYYGDDYYDYYGYDRYGNYVRNPYNPNNPYYTEEEEEAKTAKTTTKKTTKTTTKTASAPGTVTLSKEATRDTVVNQVRGASGKAVLLKNYDSVSADTLQEAARAGNSKVNFDTVSDSAVVGRLTVDPANASKFKGNLNVGVYCDTGNTAKVQQRFEDYFTNRTKVLLADQSRFDAPVEIAVKAGTLNTDSLKVYSYDQATNTYTPVSVSGVFKDSNNYLHLTTTVGGYLVLSDGNLKSA